MSPYKSAIIAAALAFSVGTLVAGGISHAATKAERSAVSKDCSTKADAQKLHGKERRAFRSKCKHEAGAKKG
ncbi:PsiF family protein [Pseudorhodoplanes sp.]|uniref:PsiF family protein n=1 Tax=Pseudorhodoplanes sp. TaxID=1934341 RepID=UPI002CC61D68|nr:PsiF family protein [Pseudorhodoplanes sp.]HWV51228.1 PsiF family protein [Pseudorhodoplanes sp.]